MVLPFLLCAFVACRKDGVDPNGGKEEIAFSLGIESQTAGTKVITDGTTSLNYFDKDKPTSVFMVMQSQYDSGHPSPGLSHPTKWTIARADVAANKGASVNDVVFDNANKRYWDDAHGRSSLLSIWAYAHVGNDGSHSFYENHDFVRYYGGHGGIGHGPGSVVYESVTPKSTESATPSFPWTFAGSDTPTPMHLFWDVCDSESARKESLSSANKDLFFSNNIADNTDVSHSDARAKFLWDQTPRRFTNPIGLKFYHALSKITINLKAGAGFMADGTDFTFPAGQNVKLIGFNNAGVFSLKKGEFEYITNSGDIQSINEKERRAKTESTPYTVILDGLVVPNIGGGDTHSVLVDNCFDYAMEFTVNGNLFKITQDALFEALKANAPGNGLASDASEYKMEAGKNYIFSFTVSKTQIDNITATVAPWEDVTAGDLEPSNARITLNLDDRGTALKPTDKFSMYRALQQAPMESDWDNFVNHDWKTGYNTTAVVPTYTETPAPAHWTTNWYWDSNRDYYHFRVLSLVNGTNKVVAPGTEPTLLQDTTDGDYYNLYSSSFGETTDAYNDILWGAPFVKQSAGYKFTYSTTKGFDGKGAEATSPTHQIYKAIGPTKDAVKLIMFHMMSDVTFNITTTVDADKVDLTDAKVSLLNSVTSAKLRIGSGLVDTQGMSPYVNLPVWRTSYTAESDPTAAKGVYHCGMVPQSLSGVTLQIKTSDNNVYKIDMSTVKTATAPTNNYLENPYSKEDGKWLINRWYPGYKYNYTFKLKKTGIDSITATVVDWENVDVDEGEVTIQ